MAIDEQQMRAIAFLTARCRPTGAKAWDEPGIVANLRKVAHLNVAEVIIASVRAAANRQADSPGVIPNLTGEHWREKVAERTTPTPPRREDQCHDCGRHLPCGCEHNSAQRPRPATQTAMATALEEARQKLADSQHTTQEAS